jgi:hypothetical protein
MVIIEQLLPHPAFSHLLPKGEGDMHKKIPTTMVGFLYCQFFPKIKPHKDLCGGGGRRNRNNGLITTWAIVRGWWQW